MWQHCMDRQKANAQCESNECVATLYGQPQGNAQCESNECVATLYGQTEGNAQCESNAKLCFHCNSCITI